jgi:hypothetical protein
VTGIAPGLATPAVGVLLATGFVPTVEVSTAEPGDIAGLWLWVKSDAGVYSDAGTTPAAADGTVQQWNDQSGNGRHFTQAVSSARPVYKTNVVNGLPGLRFSVNAGGGDTTDGMESGEGLARPLTVVVVYNYRSTSLGGRRAISGTNNWLIGPYNNRHSFFGNGGFVTDDVTVIENEFVAALVTQSATNGVCAFYVNTVDETNTPANSTFGPGDVCLAASGFPAEPLDGDIAEVIIWNRELTSGEIADVHAYLQTRYGLW